MSKFVVYMHVSPDRKKYIGITSEKPEHRWRNGKGYSKNRHFYNAILKYGWDNFRHIIIANNLSQKEACDLEKALIKGCKTTQKKYGYNMSTGGESGTYGIKFGPEFGKAISARTKGFLNPNYGKKFSKETCEKLSAVRKGKWSKKQQEALKKVWEKNGKPVVCLDTRDVFISIAEASRKTGYSQSGIGAACNGEQISSHGLHWAYYAGQSEEELDDLLAELLVKKSIVYEARHKGKLKSNQTDSKYLVPVYCIETKIAYATCKEAARRFSVGIISFYNHVGSDKTVTPGRHWKLFDEENDEYTMYVR